MASNLPMRITRLSTVLRRSTMRQTMAHFRCGEGTMAKFAQAGGDTQATSHHLPLVGLVIALVLFAVTLMLATDGISWMSLRTPLRFTARVSVVLFAVAFAAGGVTPLRPWKAAATLAFAACHFIHLGLIVARAQTGHHLGMLADLMGITAYAAIAFIAWRALATRPGVATARSLYWLEMLAWWTVWANFTLFLASVMLAPETEPSLAYPLLVGLLLVSAAARLGWRLVPAREVR